MWVDLHPHPHPSEILADHPVRLLRRGFRREDMQDPERDQMLPKKDGGGGGVSVSSPFWTLFRAGRVQVTVPTLIQHLLKSSQWLRRQVSRHGLLAYMCRGL